jgi:hypothetical protein
MLAARKYEDEEELWKPWEDDDLPEEGLDEDDEDDFLNDWGDDEEDE